MIHCSIYGTSYFPKIVGTGSRVFGPFPVFRVCGRRRGDRRMAGLCQHRRRRWPRTTPGAREGRAVSGAAGGTTGPRPDCRTPLLTGDRGASPRPTPWRRTMTSGVCGASTSAVTTAPPSCTGTSSACRRHFWSSFSALLGPDGSVSDVRLPHVVACVDGYTGTSLPFSHDYAVLHPPPLGESPSVRTRLLSGRRRPAKQRTPNTGPDLGCVRYVRGPPRH